MGNSTAVPNILVVDDDPSCCNLLKSFGQRAGWKCDVFNHGDAALEAAKSKDYDLIISDLHLPGLDNMQFMREMRALDPSRAMIVVSGTATTDQVIELLKLGAADFLQKPLDLDSLQRSVQRAIAGTSPRNGTKNPFNGFITEQTAIYELNGKELANLHFVPPLFEQLHAGGKITVNEKMQLLLAFQEALTNSLEHGNLGLESAWKDEMDQAGLDKYSSIKRERLEQDQYANLPIRIEVSYKDSTVKILIKDSGQGFIQHLPGSSLDNGKNAPELHGRGIGIISHCVDQINYSQNGTQIELVKYLGRGGEDVA